jgi:single stranded DNA-binding protein
MISSNNIVILSGRLGADPEKHTFQSGDHIINARMAVSVTRKEGNEWKDYPQWVSVKARAYAGDKLMALNKGDLITITGGIRVRQYKDKDQNNRTDTYILADRVEKSEFVNTKEDKEEQTGTGHDGDFPMEEPPF